MLDTNTVSYIARGRSPKANGLMIKAVDNGSVCLSVITEAEILYGLARRPEAIRAAHDMRLILPNLLVLPWTSSAAETYGSLRADNERAGIMVGSLDLLIAAHALAEGAVLVTNDGAIARLVGGPDTVNWTDDLRSS